MTENWQSTIHELRSVTDLEDFSDLQALKDIFQGVKYVGLGESTHGTREFFQLKHRLLAFLVKEMGFSVFSIEAGSLPCENINDYVLYGKGDRAAALASQGYWTWDTEEVRDMIEWMRQHNLSCPRERMIQFIGYDIKPVDEAYCHLRRLMTPEDLETVELDRIEALMNQEKLSTEEHADLRAKLLRLTGLLQIRDQEIRQNVGQAGLNLARHCGRILWQDYIGMKTEPYGLAARDKFMAENIIDMIHALPPDSKVVIWAHNAHIAVDPVWVNMGYLLRKEFGDLYYPAALTFTKGSFQSRYIISHENENYEMGDLQEFTVGEPRDNFWEHQLKSFAPGDFYLDFRTLRQNGDFKSWGDSPDLQMFGAGGGFIPFDDKPSDEEVFEKVPLGQHFDGIFHLQSTTRARPNPTGMRIKGQKSK